MSGETPISLDNKRGRKQNLLIKNGVYIPERSPNRTQNHATTDHVQHASLIPDIYSRHCGGANGDRNIICFPINSGDQQGNVEYLDDLEEPSFYDPPPNSSFDEVICIMATPPQATQQRHRIAADEQRTEVVDVVNLDNLRKRMAAHIETSEDQHGASVQVDDVRKRITAALVRTNQDQPKIPPLPEDPYDIPPPPKDPKDVVGTIRRARAIARLKALEEANAPKKPDKKKSLKQVPITSKSKSTTTTKKLPKKAVPQKARVAKPKAEISKSQHPPGYVSAEWAAAILRTRTLAGLKTINPKLLQKQKTPPAAKKTPSPVKTPTRQKTPTREKTPSREKTPTLENIMARIAALRSRTTASETTLVNEEQTISNTTLPDELDEFEILEELYGAEQPEQYAHAQQSGIDLRSRINVLKQQLLEHTSTIELDQNELDEFEALEEQYDARQPEHPSPQTVTDLQQQINGLNQQLLQTPQVEPLSEEKLDEQLNEAFLEDTDISEVNINEVVEDFDTEIGDEVPPKVSTPQRSRSPVAAPQPRLPMFDNAFLENIDIPEFNIDDIPEYAFSAEALRDAGFEIENEVSLGDVSMPDFDEDISLDELGVDDISAPALSDLSISNGGVSAESEYHSELLTEGQFAEDFTAGAPGFFTSIVNAVVERVKNIFSSSADGQIVVEENVIDSDTSLPNIFVDTPPQVSPISSPLPEDPEDSQGIVQRAEAIQKKREDDAIATASDPISDRKRKITDIKPSRPKSAPAMKKKTAIPKKKKRVYAPGEYSPSDVKAVARARALAGLKNVSDLLNPQRAARIAKQKAAREAEEAAIEALPPVERMREKMKKLRQGMSGLPRPSIEALATLEAIRANLPKRRTSKRKWRPAGRLRVDRRVHPSERIFRRDFGRVFAPPENVQKKSGWRRIDVMSPIAENSKFEDDDFIQFSPLRPHEGQMRLDYLRKQAAIQTAEIIRDTAEKQAMISSEAPSHRMASPRTPESAPLQFSPIQIRSPTSPRTEESRREKIITQVGPHGGKETVREEVTEISTVENGEVHTSSRQVTTKTDEYGNVTRHVQEGKGVSGEEETLREDLADIEPPDFLDTSDIPPPLDTSIPSPAEIINRIRSNVQQRLSLALPNIQQSPKSSPPKMDFPQDLTDEELFDIEAPPFDRTPQKASPQVQKHSPVERDQRMYAWGELPQEIVPKKVETPKYSPRHHESAKPLVQSPILKSPEDLIRIPPHPKDPKDYKAMIKRAQAIQKLKQQEKLAAKTALPKQTSRAKRVPISRRAEPVLRGARGHPRRRLVLKKRVPKISPKKISGERVQEHEDMDVPSEPPALPEEYIKAVARARQIHGLQNRTAVLNPAVAAQLAAEEGARAAFNALPEVEKIRRRLQILRENPTRQRRVEPSADVLGTLAAIRANMPPLEDVLQQPSTQRSPAPLSPKTPITKYQGVKTPREPVRGRSPVIVSSVDISLDEFEFLERYLGAMPATPGVQSPRQHPPSGHRRIPSPATVQGDVDIKSDTSLAEFEALEAEAEAQQLYHHYTPKRAERHKPRRLLRPSIRSPPHPEVDVPSTDMIAPSMRMLRQAGFFEDIGRFDEDLGFADEKSLPERGAPLRPHISIADAESASFYYELMEDFRIPAENVKETSKLMTETPPRNIQERLQRVKEAHSARIMPSEYAEQLFEHSVTPAAGLSPIRLISPGTTEEPEQLTTISTREENEWLLNIDETPDKKIDKIKQLRDLEDMPFDQLEYEIEPILADVSFDKPLSPPPRPSDIIRRIRAQRQQLRELARSPPQKSPEPLELPEDLPDEEMLEQSSPSFTQTPRTPHLTLQSRQVSVPLADDEVRPVTPITPPSQKPTPIKELAPPEGPIVIPPHPKDPKDYEAMIMRARMIYRLNKQKEAEEAAQVPPPKTVKKDRVPISRWQRPPPKKTSVKPIRKLVLKKREQKPVGTVDDNKEEREYKEPPPLPQEYRDAVARARLLRGLKNRTAALNPKIAAKKIAEEAAVAAFNELTEIEKIKVRLQRLRGQPHQIRGIKPTVEQIAYLEAMKQIGEYQASSPENLLTLVTPRSRPMTRAVSVTPRADVRHALLEDEELPQIDDEYLTDFEALEALLEAAPVQHPTQTVAPLDISKIVSDMRHQLATPPRPDPRERYRLLMAQRKTSTIPVASPVEAPEIRYSPITLASSPSRAERSTTQTTRSGNDTIKEQVIETSERLNGKLQHFKSLVTTTTDSQGNVTSQIKESKRVSARDRSADLELAENLEHIEEPSFLDTTPLTPLEQPRPRDIIDRVGRKLKESYKPEVPTGHLVELRTPPPVLPLPTEISEEELKDLSIPTLEKTLPPSPVRSPPISLKSPDISIPDIFAATPPSPTPPLPELSPLRHRILSPEGPIIIPRHPKDPTDYKAMVRRARKIQQLMKQKEAEARAAKEDEAKVAAERAKAKKKERVPISKWTAPPSRKPGKRKKIVMRKRGEAIPKLEEAIQHLQEPPALPEHFAKQIALSRKLAGLKSRTAVLNPKVAAREAAVAEAIRKANENEVDRAVPQRSHIRDYAAVLSRVKEMRARGAVVHTRPSLAAAAYLDALKGAMQVRQHLQRATESPRTRYNRILAARTALPSAVQEIPIRTPVHEEIYYSPIRLTSPRIAANHMDVPESIASNVLNIAAFDNLDELEELSEFEQPSFIDFSQHPVDEDQHVPLTPPITPPHLSSALISRIRQQYEQLGAPIDPQRLTSPEALEFPDDLPEEELSELSAPSFAQSPIISETPIKSPNVSIPQYFEESPPPVPSTEAIITTEISAASPPHPGVIPGIKVTTPQGSTRVPGHPKDSTDVAARVPQVARARRLAGLRPKTAPTSDTQVTTTQASASYLSLIERYAALRASKQRPQQVPTARELAHRQHLINRQQMRERRRLLHDLERQRQQQDFEFEPTRTPPTARERLVSIKSRIPAETPISSAYPYSPVKTPEVIDVPQYQPISLATTPPYQFLANVDIPGIEDISMPLDDLDNYTMGFDTAEEEDIEFQLAEIQNASYVAFDENVSVAESLRSEQENFDIAERIKMLQRQLLQSPDRDNATE